MSIAGATARVDEIQQSIQALWPVAPTATAATEAVNADLFAAAIAGVQDTGEYLSTEVIGQDIVDLAEKYVGVSQVDGGDTYNGVDDSGLYYRVLADLGVDVPRSGAEQATTGFEVGSLAAAKPGDLLVGNDGHVAIWAGDGKIIHAPRGGGQVEKVDNPYTDATLSTIRRVVPEQYSMTGTAPAAAAAVSAAPAAAGVTGAAPAATPARVAGTPAAIQALLAALPENTPVTVEASPAAAPAPQVKTTSPAAVSAAAQMLLTQSVRTDSTTPQVAAASAQSISQMVSAALGEQTATAVAATAATAQGAATVDAPAPTPHVNTLTPAVRAQFHQQVSAPVVNIAQNATGDQTLTMRVTPENLGPLTVKAQIIAGTVHIELASATDAGRDALRQILTDLRRDLAGISSTSTLSVAADSGSQSHGQSQQGSALSGGAGNGGAPSGKQEPARTSQESAAPIPTPAPPSTPVVPGTRIDLFA